MCGIFAYSGPRNVTEVLIKGLKELEYRGYDSSGVAFFNKNHIERFRVCGGADELEKKLKGFSSKDSVGIGHTRWATHGCPSEKNAHPHQSHSVYIVHNGVIENTEELKKIIGPVNLLSDTDTELISHLIYHFYKNRNLNFLDSVFKSISLLKGSYAVVAVNEERPGEIIAFKSGPPLILCKGNGKGEFFISSDLQALNQNDVEILVLEDKELLHIKDSKFQIFDFQKNKIVRKFKKHFQQTLKEGKGSHPHFMIKEIMEQPLFLNHLIDLHVDKPNRKIKFQISKGDKKEFDTLLQKAKEIIILACGSSYHVALFAKYILEDMCQIRVIVEVASEFIYRKTFVPKDTPVFFISQSGETADILSAIRKTEQMELNSIQTK